MIYEEFWVVWNPAGRAPMVRHNNLSGANGEARRLARENPGQHFYVLKALSVSVSDLVTTHNLTPAF